MSEATKIPFDSIPLDGATSAVPVTEPRPSFSRSVPDLSTAGLLPPTRKPVAVTVPDPTPPAAPAAEPNPMASTPPPKAGSVRGFIWDLVRPTRTKWAILAGGVSLAAGAYGLNLFMPTPAAPSKKKQEETAKLIDGPQAAGERRLPSVDEQRAAPPVVPKETAPAPLPSLPDKPEALKPVVPVGAQTPVEPVPLPALPKPDMRELAPLPAADDKSKVSPVPLPVPAVDLTPKPAGLPPLPAVVDKPEAVKLQPVPAPGSLPPVKTEEPKPGPLPIPNIGEKSDTLPKPAMPAGSDRPTEVDPKSKPAFAVIPDPTKKVEPLPAPVDVKPIPSPIPAPVDVKPVPVPDVKITPVGDTKPLPAPSLPPVGETVGLPNPEKPAEPIPVPKPEKPAESAPIPKPGLPDVKPVDLTPVPKPSEAAPLPTTVPAVPGKPEPLATPFKEEKPAVTPIPVLGGVKDPPPAPSSGSPAKKGFEVDVVKVRATDTYTSISETFYQSKKYAAALRAFNGDMDISRMQEVEVPPLHELQKLASVPVREAEPTSGGRTVIPARGSAPAESPVRGPVVEPTGDGGESVDWGPAGKRRSVVKYERFTTPKEGMTPRDVARAVYADENEWPRLIGPRGAKLRADDSLPRGTELTVPREELPWK